MFKIVRNALASASALLLLSSPALANDRYVQKPVVEISPDLSAPWVLQLRRGPGLVREQGIPTGLSRTSVLGANAASQDVPRKKAQRNYGVIVVEPQIRALPEPLIQQTALSVRPDVSAAQIHTIDEKWLPQEVAYDGHEKAGTIVIETSQRYLYLVEGDGLARRYGVGVGKPGFEWAGRHKISRKAEWPDWRPPAEMIERVRRKEGRILPVHMAGGPENPLGARAMYLGSSLYRIHGTNQPWTIGQNVSSGCIRMRNEDVTDLYERVGVGTQVIVR